MALDEPKATDETFDVNGIKVIMDSELARYAKGFEIDYKSSLFGKRFSVDQIYRTGGTCR